MRFNMPPAIGGILKKKMRLKAQAKLIADPDGGSKPTGKPAPPAGFGSRDQQEAGQSLVRLVRSEVRTRKKCLNHPVAAECGCC